MKEKILLFLLVASIIVGGSILKYILTGEL